MGIQIAVLLVGILMLGGIAVYLYHYLMRIMELLWLDCSHKAVKGIAAGGTMLLLLAMGFWFRSGSIIVAHFLVISWIIDAINGIAKRVNRRKKKGILSKVAASGILPVLFTIIILGYGYFNMGQVVETDYTVTTQKSIRAQGYRIALVTDLHYPTTMGEEKLKKYCQEIKSKKPDLLVLGGDIVDENTTYEEMQTAIRLLSEIAPSIGTYYVYGNHDMANYTSTPAFTKKQLEDTLSTAGIQVVEDEARQVTEDLFLVGREDCGFSNKDSRKPMTDLLKGWDKKDFILLLDHQPRELKANKKLGVDLQLSGHTHAGQIFPGGIISTWFGINEQNYGLRKDGSFTSIVSSGIAGWGSKYRTEGHSEYVIIDVTK